MVATAPHIARKGLRFTHTGYPEFAPHAMNAADGESVRSERDRIAARRRGCAHKARARRKALPEGYLLAPVEDECTMMHRVRHRSISRPPTGVRAHFNIERNRLWRLTVPPVRAVCPANLPSDAVRGSRSSSVASPLRFPAFLPT